MDTRLIRRLALGLVAVFAPLAAHAGCEDAGVQLQVLGSGGEQLAARRAGSAYLVWIDGKARGLIDIGGGAALRFGESGARVADLDVVLLTRLHADRTSDLPALVASSLSEKRERPLPVYGPPGNRFALSTVAFVREQFDVTRGVYRYLGRVLSPLARDTYRLEPHDMRPRGSRLPDSLQGRAAGNGLMPAFRNDRLAVTATLIDDREVPALVWLIEAGGKRIVIAGDLIGQRDRLLQIAKGVDVLVLPLLSAGSDTDALVLADLARRTNARQVVLSRSSPAAADREEALAARIREHYSGTLSFASDLVCIKP